MRLSPVRGHSGGAFRCMARALGLVLLVVGALAPTHASAAQAEAERVLERRVKAAFLFRFTEFVMWPASAFAKPDSPFTIAVVGRDGMLEELRQITAGRVVHGRAVEVRSVPEGDPMPPAQIVFVAESEKTRVRDWIRLAPKSALIVTESEGALAQGSIINFIIAESRVRFEIALETAEKRGLRMSSRLLAVAQTVRTGVP